MQYYLYTVTVDLAGCVNEPNIISYSKLHQCHCVVLNNMISLHMKGTIDCEMWSTLAEILCLMMLRWKHAADETEMHSTHRKL